MMAPAEGADITKNGRNPSEARWGEFLEQSPEIAMPGRELLYQFGLGLAFLATVRKDGGPRMHPVCPVIYDGGLYVFVVGRSPKRYDLLRDDRYALHSFPPEENDDAFFCTGSATPISDSDSRALVASGAKHNVQDNEMLFELRIDRALHTTWEKPRQPNTRAIHTKWSVADQQ